MVPLIPPFEQKKREYMCAGRWQSHTHPYPECSSQRLPEHFFFSCSAKRCSGSVWRQTQSRQHIAGAPHWAAHSHIRDIRQPNYIYLSKMQKVFSAFRGESRLKYAKRTGRASGVFFFFWYQCWIYVHKIKHIYIWKCFTLGLYRWEKGMSTYMCTYIYIYILYMCMCMYT